MKDAPKLLNIKREDIFMMSMVPREMMGYDLTKKAVAASLAQLQVEHIDLVMFHHRAGEGDDDVFSNSTRPPYGILKWNRVVQSADISAEPLSMKPMKAFPDHPDGVCGRPPPRHRQHADVITMRRRSC